MQQVHVIRDTEVFALLSCHGHVIALNFDACHSECCEPSKSTSAVLLGVVTRLQRTQNLAA